MRPRTSFRIRASASRCESEIVSNARAWTFGRSHVSNGNRAANGSRATNAPLSATTRRPEASSRRRIFAEQALALPLLGVRTHALHLLEDPERHDRDRHDLRVRVRVGGAGSFPVILEDLDVHDSAVRGEVVITLAVCAQDLFDLAIVQRREVTVMVGGLDDDLVRPDAVDAHERPVPMLADFPGPFERREFVRDAADRPARSVRLATVPIREDFRWRHGLVALAERTALLRGRILRIPEGPGPLGAGRGKDDPCRRCVVFADLRHSHLGDTRAGPPR